MSTDRKFRGVAILPDLDQLMRMHKATVDDMTHTMFIGDKQIPLTDFKCNIDTSYGTNTVVRDLDMQKTADTVKFETALVDLIDTKEAVTGIVMHEDDLKAMTRAVQASLGNVSDPEQVPTAMYGVPLIAVKLPFMKGHVVKLKNNQTFADWFEQNYRRQE